MLLQRCLPAGLHAQGRRTALPSVAPTSTVCSTSGRTFAAAESLWGSRRSCIVGAAALDRPKSARDALDEILDPEDPELDVERLQVEDSAMELVVVAGSKIEDDVEDKRQGGLPEGLPLPAERYQRALTYKEIREHRTRSNTLAKYKDIVRITIGVAGVTQNFLVACADALGSHELLRVKLGEGSGLDRAVTAEFLERHLDAVCVHQVGFTITLYRQMGLPRPSNLPIPEARLQQQEAAAAAAAGPSPERLKKEAQKQRREAAAAERKRQQQQEPKPPPEFEVIS